ncbi:MAG: rhodanese-like domain-containing protein [Desulfofustis sp.]
MLKIRIYSILLMTFLLTFSTASLAGDYKVIGHAELKQLVDSDSHTFLLVDARNPEEYRESHIPGAINIPEKKFQNFIGLLPSDKNMNLITTVTASNVAKVKRPQIKRRSLAIPIFIFLQRECPFGKNSGIHFTKVETTKNE